MITTMIMAIIPALTGRGWMPEWGGVFNHLWQSTVFAAVAALLALGLRKNHARARYWLWLAASCKFLVPFSLLVSLGVSIGTSVGSGIESIVEKLWRTAPAIVAQPAVTDMFDEISQPFTQVSAPADAPARQSLLSAILPEILLGIWMAGCAVVLISWFRRWLRVRAAVRAATPVHLELPVQLNVAADVFPHPLPDGRGSVTEDPRPDGGPEHEAGLKAGSPARLPAPHRIRIMSSPAMIEPGIFGIFRPVLLLPEGIADRLTPAQLQSILAHELCHVKRRDNLAAAMHMIVEAAFWFHPLVWWIGARLVEERERACDEEVLLRGSEPGVYAESILQVCKFYLESPLKCVAGVTGSDLKKRIESIMSGLPGRNLSRTRKLLLVAASMGAVAGPVIFGVLAAPHIRAQVAQQSAAAAAAPKWEVASIRPCDSSGPQGRSGGRSGGSPSSLGRLNLNCAPVGRLIEEAYGIFSNGRGPNWNHFVFEGVPAWANSERYTIEAKAESPQGYVMMQGPMMQALLEERFKLKIRREIREVPVYNLTVVKGGPKNLQPSKPDSCIALDWDHMPPPTKGVEFCEMIGRGVARDATVGSFQVFGITMPKFAEGLGALLDRNVIDKTGISGKFDIKVPIPLEDLTPPPPDDASPPRAVQRYRDDEIVFSAMRQLGMKLESAKGPGEVFVIEHVERPSDNFEPPVAATQAPAQPARTFDGPAPSFEVASIRPHQGTIVGVGMDISGTRVMVYASTVSDLVGDAYNVKDFQVTGVADWMRSERYDIAAKAAGDSTPTAGRARQMLQTLLTERFRLKFHRETKEMPVYALVVGKNGPKLKENAAGPGILKFNPKGRDVELVATGAPIDSLVSQLPRMPGVDRPVADKTGLTGKYDFRITLTDFQLNMNVEQRGVPAADSVGASVFAALQEQLGLKLESTKAPVEIIVIDHAEKPSDNFEPPAAKQQALHLPAAALDGSIRSHTVAPQTVAPQMTVAAEPQSQPAPPVEKPLAFEVAEVKVNKSADPEMFGDVVPTWLNPGGRVTIRGATMKWLISEAYRVGKEGLAGAPNWLDTDCFDVIAKAAPTASRNDVRLMLQKLLAERFGLRVHQDQKVMPVYALVVGKRGPKLLKPSDDPKMKDGCQPASGASGQIHLGCHNLTMADLADSLPQMAPVFIDLSVVDLTDLKGTYDFKLDWSPRRGAGGPGRGADAPTGIDSAPGLTMFDAVEALGLKLEKGKHAINIVVIDHVDRVPTEN